MCFGQAGGAAGGPSSANFGAGDQPAVGSADPTKAGQGGQSVPLPRARPTTLLSGMDIEADKPSPNRPTPSEAQRSGEGDGKTLDAGTTPASQTLAYRKKRDQSLMEA